MLHCCVVVFVLATKLPSPTQAEAAAFLRRLQVFMRSESPSILIENGSENRQGLIVLKIKDPLEGIRYLTRLQPWHICQLLVSDSGAEAA